MTDALEPQDQAAPADDGLREFFMVLRQALLMVVRWIERRYNLCKK
jgi:hypothetical protein